MEIKILDENKCGKQSAWFAELYLVNFKLQYYDTEYLKTFFTFYKIYKPVLKGEHF